MQPDYRKAKSCRSLTKFAEIVPSADVDPLLAVELDAGEASVIHTAIVRGIPLVLIDERKGRRVARRVYGLQTIGTTRVLVEAKRRGLLDAVIPALNEMRAAGYWIADDIVAWAKSASGE